MPRKIRELKAMIKRSGYILQPEQGKGSHSWWEHPLLPDYPLCIPGQDGDDAGAYLEKQAGKALRVLAERIAKPEEDNQ
jgi:hypothetical protein